MAGKKPASRSSRGGNKGIVALLIGGFAILAAAGVVYFVKHREDAAPKTEPPPKIEQAVPTPAPLVVAQKTLPVGEPDDAGSDILTEKTDGVPDDHKTGKRRGGGGVSEPTGTIDPKAVDQFMNARFGQVKTCYERRLKMNPLLEGKLDLNIGISTKGKVTSITVNGDTLRDSELASCVKRTIRGWTFPKPEGGRVIVAKTFNFKKKT